MSFKENIEDSEDISWSFFITTERKFVLFDAED